MINALDLKSGMIFQYEGTIFSVTSATHTHQQQRRGLVRCKAKELKSGKTQELVLRSDVRLEQVYVDETVLTYLYRDAEGYHFMDESTYEQVAVSADLMGDSSRYMKENQTVTGLSHQGKMLDVKLPFFIEMKVTETEPGFRGDTVSAAKKRATLETGLVVLVPLFIEIGDVVKVDTRTDEYLTRVTGNET